MVGIGVGGWPACDQAFQAPALAASPAPAARDALTKSRRRSSGRLPDRDMTSPSLAHAGPISLMTIQGASKMASLSVGLLRSWQLQHWRAANNQSRRDSFK
jgi:hypothetical protein